MCGATLRRRHIAVKLSFSLFHLICKQNVVTQMNNSIFYIFVLPIFVYSFNLFFFFHTVFVGKWLAYTLTFRSLRLNQSQVKISHQ